MSSYIIYGNALAQYPEADANGDGVLTMPEARAALKRRCERFVKWVDLGARDGEE